MLNIVIPMAGAGSRFSRAGYTDPKPLIKVHDIPMIRLVIENLKPSVEHHFIFIIQKEHDEKYNLSENLNKWAPGCSIILLDSITEGAACTVLTAKHLIDNDNALMIANSDQFVDISIDDYLAKMERSSLAGLIMTMTADDPKWSFVGLDSTGNVSIVVEKEVISNEATVGIYNFRSGSSFVLAAQKMISRNERINNEFYVAPAYNSLINDGMQIGIYNIGTEGKGMYGLGIPEDLNLFLQTDISLDITGSLIP
ncbi:glycosyltransferase family 2 protein [Pseudomonas protegens]|uniref:glycosyltransferase family 2 protein n=1 Tax=Pseudomonas protegens TaxID=380021 RepID=UPI002024BB7A|nr:glycosyltransferase family 2 protein [Pseudomonas protegens]MCL9657978.1 glycosyltransferase family 2 protein [Pseudomonas protegens]